MFNISTLLPFIVGVGEHEEVSEEQQADVADGNVVSGAMTAEQQADVAEEGGIATSACCSAVIAPLTTFP